MPLSRRLGGFLRGKTGFVGTYGLKYGTVAPLSSIEWIFTEINWFVGM